MCFHGFIKQCPLWPCCAVFLCTAGDTSTVYLCLHYSISHNISSPPVFIFLFCGLFSASSFLIISFIQALTQPHSPVFFWLLSCHHSVICIFWTYVGNNCSRAEVEAGWLQSKLWCIGCLRGIWCQTPEVIKCRRWMQFWLSTALSYDQREKCERSTCMWACVSSSLCAQL